MTPAAILWQYREAFVAGLKVTVELVGFAVVIGTALAISLELLCHRLEGGVRLVVNAIAFGLSAIPTLVVLFWLHYPAQVLLGVVIAPFWSATAALVLLNTFSVYRIVADSVREFPQQFVSAGRVCGLSQGQIARFIQAPLLIRSALPRWLDQQVVILQTSLFASLISVEETFRVAQRVNSIVYQPVLIYTAMAILFLFAAGIPLLCAVWLRKHYSRDLSER